MNWELMCLCFKKSRESDMLPANKQMHSDCNTLRFATCIATGDLQGWAARVQLVISIHVKHGNIFV